MRKRSILVSISVLLMGAVPASALVQKSKPKGLDVFGQEASGIVSDLSEESKKDLYGMMARLGMHSDDPMGDGQEGKGNSPREDRERQTVAGFCNECLPNLGQEGKGRKVEDPDVIQDGPYKGYRLIQTKVTGGHDSRELVGPHDSDHSAAVGMVYCEKVVNGKVEYKYTTGTLVASRDIVLASRHGFFKKNRQGNVRFDYDYAKDCEFRKYQANGSFYAYAFTYAKKGNYRGARTHRNGDWTVLKLERKAYGQKAMVIDSLNTSLLKDDSKHPIEVIGHQHDKKKADGTPDNEGIYRDKGIMRSTTYNGERTFGHTADTNGRASGAAIVYTESDGTKVVYGIHVTGYDQQDLNRFIPINSEILDAVDAVMAFDGVSI